MDFELSEEDRMLKELVHKFVRDELMPLEAAVLAREAEGKGLGIGAAEHKRIDFDKSLPEHRIRRYIRGLTFMLYFLVDPLKFLLAGGLQAAGCSEGDGTSWIVLGGKDGKISVWDVFN